MAKALIDADANVNALDKKGRSALWHALNQQTGHDWQKEPFKILEQYLKGVGAKKIPAN